MFQKPQEAESWQVAQKKAKGKGRKAGLRLRAPQLCSALRASSQTCSKGRKKLFSETRRAAPSRVLASNAEKGKKEREEKLGSD
ncbi:hypothetical protein EBZ37_06510 [bacterium]|nr:hypothetical protein [bacterium]